jgi:phosphoadenosine phosphosulfate reductase
MKMPFLGRIVLRWCFNCNVPVLAKKCSTCKDLTIKVPITPPGDVRPAFEKDIEIINMTVEDQFGSSLIANDRIVLLNSVPGLDRFDEVIVDGVVVGALRFSLESLSYEFLPRIEGASRINKKAIRGFVTVADDAANYIKQGMSVLMPGVVDFDRDLGAGQEVIVNSGDQAIAVGKTRFSGAEAERRKNGMFVKVRRYRHGEMRDPSLGGQDWEDVIRANNSVLEEIENEALKFIEKTLGTYDLPVVVSFSGGKDSLATLLLVKRVVTPKILFIDTGIEFPETLEYVREVVGHFGLDLVTEGAGDRFWRGFKAFGMSGRDYRWCCKVCKLGPVAKIIHSHFPDGVLNFIGQRRYESRIRARSGRVWRNSWLPKQVSASPVQNWSALHIWLFLMKEKALTNPLYQLGLERIGCWLCPSSDISEIHLFKELHPDLWQSFEEGLQAQGYSSDEIRHGFWRWRNLPKGQGELRSSLEIESGNGVKSRIPISDDLPRMENLSSSLRIPATEDVALRSKLCLGCGVCLAHCDHDAIEFREGKIWIRSNCLGCKKCHVRCPIVKYLYEKI